jgi:hypothetical protein
VSVAGVFGWGDSKEVTSLVFGRAANRVAFRHEEKNFALNDRVKYIDELYWFFQQDYPGSPDFIIKKIENIAPITPMHVLWCNFDKPLLFNQHWLNGRFLRLG